MALQSSSRLQQDETTRQAAPITASPSGGEGGGTVANVLRNEVLSFPENDSPERTTVSDTANPEAEIQSAIDRAANNGGGAVIIGRNLPPWDTPSINHDLSVDHFMAGSESDGHNVRAYGAAGDGITDDQPAVARALDRAKQRLGRVYLPGGHTYYIGTQMSGSAGLTLYGDGWSSKVICPGQNAGAFKWRNGSAVDVIVRDLWFDVNSGNAFDSAVSFRGDTDGPVRISNCKFTDSGVNDEGVTLEGILNQGCSNFLVENCFLDGVQIKGAGREFAHENIRIINNTVVNSNKQGITAVVRDNGSLKGVSIEGNTVRGASLMGVFVGSDGSSQTGVQTKDISVRNNNISLGTETTLSPAACINVVGGDAESETPQIEGNILNGQTGLTDTFGIRAQGVDSITITDNEFTGTFAKNAVRLIEPADVLLTGNQFRTSGGAEAVVMNECGGVVAHNIFDGRGTNSLSLRATNADKLDIHHNRWIDNFIGNSSGAISLGSFTGLETSARIHRNRFVDNEGNFNHAIRARNDGSFDIKVANNDFRGVDEAFSSDSDVADVLVGENRGFSPDITVLRDIQNSYAWKVRDLTNSTDLLSLLESGKIEVDKVGVGTITDPGATFETDEDLLIRDSQTDPSQNGEFRQNDGDVKVYTGGRVINLTTQSNTIGDRYFSLTDTVSGFNSLTENLAVINTGVDGSALTGGDRLYANYRITITSFDHDEERDVINVYPQAAGENPVTGVRTYNAANHYAQTDVSVRLGVDDNTNEIVLILFDDPTDFASLQLFVTAFAGRNTDASLFDMSVSFVEDLTGITVTATSTQQGVRSVVTGTDRQVQSEVRTDTRFLAPELESDGTDYSGGWGGSGFQLTEEGYNNKADFLEVSHLSVRGTLRVRELEVRQLTFSKGPFGVTPGAGKLGEVLADNGSVTAPSDFDGGAVEQEWDFENSGDDPEKPGLTVGDRVLAQRFDADSQTVVAQVRAVVDNRQSPYKFTVKVDNAYSVPSVGADTEGYEFIVVGNPSDGGRDNFLLLNPYAPSTTAYDGVSGFDDWDNRANFVRYRAGNLNSYYDYTSDVYGFAAGKANEEHITADDTKGVRIRDGDTDETFAKLSGTRLTLGSETNHHIRIDPNTGGVQFFDSSLNEVAQLNSDVLRLGHEQDPHIKLSLGSNGLEFFNDNGEITAKFVDTELQLGKDGQIRFDPTLTPEAKIEGTLELRSGGQLSVFGGSGDERVRLDTSTQQSLTTSGTQQDSDTTTVSVSPGSTESFTLTTGAGLVNKGHSAKFSVSKNASNTEDLILRVKRQSNGEIVALGKLDPTIVANVSLHYLPSGEQNHVLEIENPSGNSGANDWTSRSIESYTETAEMNQAGLFAEATTQLGSKFGGQVEVPSLVLQSKGDVNQFSNAQDGTLRNFEGEVHWVRADGSMTQLS